MGWNYESGIYQGYIVNIKGYNRLMLEEYIEDINKKFNLKMEIITNDETTLIHQIGIDECFIFLKKEIYRDEHFSYSSMSSISVDNYGNQSFPIYFKLSDKEYILSENEDIAFLKIREYFNEDIELEQPKVYSMGIVFY